MCLQATTSSRVWYQSSSRPLPSFSIAISPSRPTTWEPKNLFAYRNKTRGVTSLRNHCRFASDDRRIRKPRHRHVREVVTAFGSLLGVILFLFWLTGFSDATQAQRRNRR